MDFLSLNGQVEYSGIKLETKATYIKRHLIFLVILAVIVGVEFVYNNKLLQWSEAIMLNL
jgi:hypothetical protein